MWRLAGHAPAKNEQKKLESRLRAAFFFEALLPSPMSLRLLARLAAAATPLLLAGCAGLSPEPPAPQALDQSAWARASSVPPLTQAEPPAAWEFLLLPGKSPVRFASTRHHGRVALAADADAAASGVRRRLRVEPPDLGRLRFSWFVPELIATADLGHREADDSPVRIVLAFEGDRSKLSPRDRMLSELARALTGEELPYATLMYVWCNQRPAGSVIPNPRTDRIRKFVVESGGPRLNRWLDYERDIRADFERAFGEPPGALVAIGVMTDTDNTRTATRAWYGPLHLVAARRR